MLLDGMLTIPVTPSTYPYCWQPISLGVYVESPTSMDEVTTENNFAFYDVILDCGSKSFNSRL